MSIYLGHSGMFNRNQFRVLFDWFDFIHRCCFHSRWSCQTQGVIPSLDLHTSFHSTQLHSMIIAYSMLTFSLFVCLFVPNLLPPFSGHWFRIQSSIDSFPSFTTTQIGLASMFQSFVWSMLRMKKGIYEKWKNQTETIEFDSMFKIEMCYTLPFCGLVTIESKLSSEWTGLYWIVS